MASADPSGAWRDLRVSGLLGRFVLLCLGVLLHAADTLVTATTVPAIVEELGGVAYVGWTYRCEACNDSSIAALRLWMCNGRHCPEHSGHIERPPCPRCRRWHVAFAELRRNPTIIC